MTTPRSTFAEKRRILQLETLYDLALTLDAHRPEQELVDELLQRVCAILDPGAAVAVTRDPYGSPRAVASVGWSDAPPDGSALLDAALWRELLASGQILSQRDGFLANRPFTEILATPLAGRGVYLGYLAVLDKEQRGSESVGFTTEDRRFLESVSVLAGTALDSARQVELLETQRERLQEENKALKDHLVDQVGGQRFVANSDAMRRVLELVERVAPRNVSVVLRGDSGTGKELVAKLLYLQSGRSGSLVTLNCSALPESLLESELFGIEGGVATGVKARRGKFELADGGSLFLDEIGDMRPTVQVKLLRALQEREVVRIGGHQAIPVDVRLIAATNRDLDALVAEGIFREDLYYRLKGVEIFLPPLKERRQDIPHMVRYFSEEFCRREGLPRPRFEPEVLELLLAHEFPGNVRELKNLIEAALSLSEGPVEVGLVRSLLGDQAPVGGPEPLDMATVERRHIGRILRLTDGNKSRAAKLLGLDRRTLQRKGF